MINKNLDINLNSMVSLNGINYKSNQHRESFPYELGKIHPKMLQRDGVVMTVMKVLVVVVMMMIPMKPSSMAMTMAMISPPPGMNFPRRFLPAGELSLCVCFPPRRGGGVYLRSPLVLGFWGDDIREGAMAEVGPGSHTTRRRGLGLACATRWGGSLVAHLALSFWLLPSSGEI
jgi:hypothetical protein